MSALTRRDRIFTQEQTSGIICGVIGGLLAIAAGFILAGAKLDGSSTDGILKDAITGQPWWTDGHTTLAWTIPAVLLPAILIWWFGGQHIFGKRRPVARISKHLATRYQVRSITEQGRRKTIKARAKRKGTPTYKMPCLGFLGRTLTKLYFGPEDTGLVITGPRQNKSSSIANPFIIEAPGAVLATSNKPDVISETMDQRPGDKFIYDPQNVYTGPNPSPMYWDPLSSVRNVETARVPEKATALASRFIFASGATSKSDTIWERAATEILSSLIIAAALTPGKTMRDVYRWVVRPNDIEPINLLAELGETFTDARLSLDDHAHRPDKQRAGEYSNAQTAISFMANPVMHQWVVPSEDRMEFTPDMMFTGTPTLYIISMEGEASAGPLTAALTIAVAEAAIEEANRHGGRLPIPMFLVLDEVANVCRWNALPDLYTHLGSRGILVISMLQNYSQGKEVWGEDRMKLLLSAASIFITGGGVKDNGFHEAVVNMLPKYSRRTTSESAGKSGRSTSTSITEENLLDVSDMRNLPREYSILFVSNLPPMVLRMWPVFRRRYGKNKRHTMTTQEPQPITNPVRRVEVPATRETAPATAPAPSGWGGLDLED